jgi:multidrug efflux system outer membrane protein
MAIATALLASGVAHAQSGDPGAAASASPVLAGPKEGPKPHAFTLAECLDLADKNAPQLWAARARLAQVHGQLDEVKWTPFSQFTAQAAFGVLPPIVGTVGYTSSSYNVLSTAFGQGFQPFFRFEFSGVVPLWTFGKITSSRDAAEAGVRVSEWDLEKVRQEAHWDVRRAFFGLMLARDAKYAIDEIVGYMDKGIQGLREKAEKGGGAAAENEGLKLEVYREEIYARGGEAEKGGAAALAGLRFLTGVQTGFDIPDQPLKRPDKPMGALAQYLEAARLFRPEINMARAGVLARKHMVDYQRARLFPDIGVAFMTSFANSPSATMQNNAWVQDPFNRFLYGGLIGAKWSLDILPQQARIAQAEAQLEETRAMERMALGGVATEVETAYASAAEAKAREEAWDRAEHKAKKWLATIANAIDVGGEDEKALLEPLKAYANARAMHLVALHDYNRELSALAMKAGWESSAPTGS